jgi:hypothetical protein
MAIDTDNTLLSELGVTGSSSENIAAIEAARQKALGQVIDGFEWLGQLIGNGLGVITEGVQQQLRTSNAKPAGAETPGETPAAPQGGPVTVDPAEGVAVDDAETAAPPRAAGDSHTPIPGGDDEGLLHSLADLLVRSNGKLIGLTSSPGFRDLSPQDQVILVAYVGGNTAFSLRALNALSQWRMMPGNETADGLRRFLLQQPGLARVTYHYLPALRGAAQHSGPMLLGTDKFSFESGEAQLTNRYRVFFGTHSVDIYEPVAPPPDGLFRPSLDQIIQALAMLPPEVRGLIYFVFLEPFRSSGDDFLSKLYKKEFHSWMGAFSESNSISIYPALYDQTVAAIALAMVHEVGHFLMDQHVTRNDWIYSRKTNEATYRALADDYAWVVQQEPIAPSTYAQGELQEDFAEFFALYMAVRGTVLDATFRAMMPLRFQFMDDLVNKHLKPFIDYIHG